MIEQNKRGLLIVISAPSGTGKSTITSELLKTNNRYFSISTTTREKRSNDIEGVTYNFVSKEEFLKRIDEDYFIEYTSYAGNYYGTPKNIIEEKLSSGIDVFLEIEVEGAKNIKKIYPEAILIFILPPSIQELINRLQKRGTDDFEKIYKRLNKAYDEIKEINNYEYVIVNNDLTKSISDIESIITSHKCLVKNINKIKLDIEKKDLENYLKGC